MNSQLSIDDIKSFIRRRKVICLVSFSAIFVCAIIIAAVLPPIYRSQATIRITEPQIADDFVKSAYDITPEARLEGLTNIVMSNIKLEKVVKAHNLYPELQRKGTMNQAVEKIRQAISVAPSFTGIINPRTGRSIPVISAIIVSFEGGNPGQVKDVTQALSNLYIEEDVRKREERASGTTQFLEGELARLQKQIEDQEAKINNFKREHIGELPENMSSNFQMVSKLERELKDVDNHIRLLESRKINLNGQLSTITPLAPIKTNQGQIVRDPYERLRGLKVELLQLQTHLSDKHPDVIRTKREIAKLEKELGTNSGEVDKSQLIERKRTELTRLEEQFGEKHPDVVKLRSEISYLTGRLKNKNNFLKNYAYQRPDNPVYIGIMTQIEEVGAELTSWIEKKGQIAMDLVEYNDKINNAPIVETRFNTMTRTLENTKKVYNELTNKLMEARVYQAVEKKDKGTKFTLQDPAYLPDKPYKPNRQAIVALGFLAAVCSGLGAAGVKEATDRSIKSEKELSELVDVPVLTTIALVGKDKTNKRKRHSIDMN